MKTNTTNGGMFRKNSTYTVASLGEQPVGGEPGNADQRPKDDAEWDAEDDDQKGVLETCAKCRSDGGSGVQWRIGDADAAGLIQRTQSRKDQDRWRRCGR